MPSKKHPVLIVVAHPDDELFISGTLCLLSERGYSTHLLCVTGGYGAVSDDNGSEQTYRIRRFEMALSAETLGVNALSILPYANRPSENWRKAALDWNLEALNCELMNTIQSLEPIAILTHGPLGGYGHPAHKQVFRSVAQAADHIGYRNAIYSFCGKVGKFDTHWRYFDQASDVIITVRKYLDRRATALNYHQSQWSFFLKPTIPQGLRGLAGVILPLLLSFSRRGRRRLPIYTARNFFKRFPEEGLVRQKLAETGGEDLFMNQFRDDPAIRFVTSATAGASSQPDRTT